MNYIALFFAGAFLCNCIPHLSAGLQGMPFPTPFAKPRGIGNSSPQLNFLWGSLNVCAGLLIVSRHPFVIGPNFECLAAAAGALLLGVHLSRYFGRVRSEWATSA